MCIAFKWSAADYYDHFGKLKKPTIRQASQKKILQTKCRLFSKDGLYNLAPTIN